MKKVSLIFALLFTFTQSGWASEAPAPQQVSVSVTENGFEPARLQVEAGREVLLTVTRKTDATCAKSIIIPKLKLKETLPLNKAVTLKLPKLEKGELKFSCGMGMISAFINAN